MIDWALIGPCFRSWHRGAALVAVQTDLLFHSPDALCRVWQGRPRSGDRGFTLLIAKEWGNLRLGQCVGKGGF